MLSFQSYMHWYVHNICDVPNRTIYYGVHEIPFIMFWCRYGTKEFVENICFLTCWNIQSYLRFFWYWGNVCMLANRYDGISYFLSLYGWWCYLIFVIICVSNLFGWMIFWHGILVGLKCNLIKGQNCLNVHSHAGFMFKKLLLGSSQFIIYLITLYADDALK